jgi:hypothetical protein
VDTDNIGVLCGAPPKAGIRLLFAIVCGSNVISIPPVVENLLATKPVLKADKKWNTWVISEENQDFKITKGKDGKVKFAAKFWLPGVTTDKTHTLEAMAGDGRIIAFRDMHDNTYLVGEVISDWGVSINGCFVHFETQLTGKNGYMVTIEWDGTSMPPCLAPTAAVAMAQDFKV